MIAPLPAKANPEEYGLTGHDHPPGAYDKTTPNQRQRKLYAYPIEYTVPTYFYPQ